MAQFTPPPRRFNPFDLLMMQQRRKAQAEDLKQRQQEQIATEKRGLIQLAQKGLGQKFLTSFVQQSPNLTTDDLNIALGIDKQISEQKKQDQEAQERGELFKSQLGPLAQGVQAGADPTQVFGGLNPVQQQALFRRVLATGATAEQEERQRQVKAREEEARARRQARFERQLTVDVPALTDLDKVQLRLRDGVDPRGRPLSNVERKRLEVKANRLSAGSGGTFFQSPDGTVFAMGVGGMKAMSRAATEELVVQHVEASQLVSDLESVIQILEERAGRAGTVGGLQRAVVSMAGIMSDITKIPGNQLETFAQSVLTTMEDDLQEGRVNDELRDRMVPFFEDPRFGELDALEFYVMYNIARQVKRKGKLTNQDIERATKAFGFTRFGRDSQRTIVSLRRALDRSTQLRDLLRDRITSRDDTLTIKPDEVEQRFEQGQEDPQAVRDFLDERLGIEVGP